MLSMMASHHDNWTIECAIGECVYVCIYRETIYTCVHTHIYIYIDIEREREREIIFLMKI